MTNLNTIFSLFTIGTQILIVILLISFFTKQENPLLRFFSKNALWIAFLVAIVATGLSLFYSEIAGFEPCKLCWYQRIFLYPQLVLFGVALWRKNDYVTDYSLILSLFGGAIALYHYYGQMLNPSVLPCAVVGLTPACSQRFFVEFGYITIPMMALTTFVLMAVLMIIRKKQVGETLKLE